MANTAAAAGAAGAAAAASFIIYQKLSVFDRKIIV